MAVTPLPMPTELAKAYDPREVEERWARQWVRERLFTATPDPAKQPFSIVIPPPNITGQLHLGHALNNTLQDVLIRYRKMDGYDTLWVPGTDHASIATQNVVERQLTQQGTNRHEIGREEFLQRTFAWKAEVGPYIVAQLQRLGAGCDWTRERFTMDEGLSRAVREVFVRLFEEGLIYRGRRLINWCCRCGTALSDIEVEREETQGSLWHLRYPLLDGSNELVVATTRPETMLGDTAVAVHPEDARYQRFVGRQIRLPVLGRAIPIVADEHVDREFGSGAVKITPAHDFDDFEIASRHGLEAIPVIDETGRMTPAAGPYAGLDRSACRERIVADLESQGVLARVESHILAVGRCYRCHSVVEPLLSTQWFVRAKPLADPAIEAVRDGRTRFFPEHWSKTYFAWLTNIRDWCISRQLWWGHRIPAWYCDRCTEVPPGGGEPQPRVLVAREAPAACPGCGGVLRQDEDVLDTWFSSGLWPFSTLGWPERTADLERYYPTAVLVTGFDILFFWVARMMMFGLRFTGEVPFRHVYVHGLVRDEYGAKMSKSKGNVRDPLELLATYGTDALRFTLVAQSAMGRDIRLSLDRIDGNRAFANKIWNAARFVLMNLEGYEPGGAAGEPDAAARWIATRLSRATEEMRAALDGYRFNDAAQVMYRFLWNEFCDWYVELAKGALASGDAARRRAAQRTLVETLDAALRLLHPLMPFVTEELSQALPAAWRVWAAGSMASAASMASAGSQRLACARYPRPDDFGRDPEAEEEVERLIEVVRTLRNIRAEMSLAPAKPIEVLVVATDPELRRSLEGMVEALGTLARVASLRFLEDGERPRGAAVATAGGAEFFVPLAGLVDVAAERDRLERALAKIDQEIGDVRRKLGNQSFVARAPEEIVAKERARLAQLEAERTVLATSFERLAEVGA